MAFRWCEILDPSGTVTLKQQDTFAPDTTFRWMTSAAMDKVNNIVPGASLSTTALNVKNNGGGSPAVATLSGVGD